MSSWVLVTGGAGYVGSHTVMALLGAGYRVVVVDDLSLGHRASLPLEEVELVEGDVRDAAALDRACRGRDVVAALHFAANSQVGESMLDPLRYLGDNVEGAIALLRACERHGIDKLVLSSTAAVYGAPEAMPIEESARLAPTSPYGESKLMIERMLAWQARQKGLRWAALRYFNAAGADPSGERGEHHDPETHLVPIVLQVAAGTRKEVAVFGDDYDTRDGTCIRDYVHVSDLADAHVRALAALDSHDRIEVNLGTSHGASVNEIIELAREVTGHPVPSRIAMRRPGDPPVLVASNHRAKELLGWAPQRDLRAIIETAWNWHRSHPEGFEGG
jgi:UDP-glucose 4-epimerase